MTAQELAAKWPKLCKAGKVRLVPAGPLAGGYDYAKAIKSYHRKRKAMWAAGLTVMGTERKRGWRSLARMTPAQKAARKRAQQDECYRRKRDANWAAGLTVLGRKRRRRWKGRLP